MLIPFRTGTNMFYHWNLLDCENGSSLWYRLLFKKHVASQENNLTKFKDKLNLLNVFYSYKHQFGAKLTTGPSFRCLPKFLSKALDHLDLRIMQLPISASRPPPTTKELRYCRMLRNYLARNLFALRRTKTGRTEYRSVELRPYRRDCSWWGVGTLLLHL
jgi:hypothetical protein